MKDFIIGLRNLARMFKDWTDVMKIANDEKIAEVKAQRERQKQKDKRES